MFQIAVICAALGVLGVAVVMIFRELRGTRKSPHALSEPAKVAVPARPSGRVMAPVAVLAAGALTAPEEDQDVTLFGARPPSLLPRLGVDADGDTDDVAGDSTAMTMFEDGAEVDEPTGPTDLVMLSAAAQSDVGKRRRRNEDSYLVDNDRLLFVVADGMGGYAGGDVASQLATSTIARSLSGSTAASNPGSGHSFAAPLGKIARPRVARELVSSIEAANAAIWAEAQKNPDFHGMGTTIVAASFTRRKRRGYIAYAGDSRCYRLRDRKLKLLTSDHTFAAKGVGGAMGSQIRRAVGARPTIKVDLIVDSPRPGDLYVLCSDGLNKMLSDEELEKLIVENRHDLAACAQTLVERANDAGGKDNVTVIVVSVHELDERQPASSAKLQPLIN
jgi:serine/threonine protein phosphatase PrpC